MTLTEAIEIVVNDYRVEDGDRVAELGDAEVIDLAREELDKREVNSWWGSGIARHEIEAYLMVIAAADGEINDLLAYIYG